MQFYYHAKDQAGKVKKGIVEADTKDLAAQTLQARGLIPISIVSGKDIPFFARRMSIFDRVKDKDIVLFTRQLSILIGANVPLVDAIKTLRSQIKSPVFQEIIFKIGTDVEGGAALSEAMARHPKVFSSLFVNLVHSGESSGDLQNSLLYLADYLEKQHDLKGKVKGAMVYPAFVITILVLVGVAMMIWVIPKLTTLITQAGSQLPLPTRILIGTSNFMRSFWWLLLLIIGGGAFIVRFILSTPAGKQNFDRIKLRLPVFGSLLKKIYMARFADNLSTLLAGGIPIVESIQTTSKVIGNTIYENIMINTANKVRAGVPMHTVLKQHKQIPGIVTQMIETGEKTGKIVESLNHISKFYSREIDNTIASLSQLMEPIIIVIMGIGVAVLVASILMPVYQVATSV